MLNNNYARAVRVCVLVLFSSVSGLVQAGVVGFSPDDSLILNPERGLAKLMEVGDDSIEEVAQLRDDNHTIAWGVIRLDAYRHTDVLPASKINEINRWLNAVRENRVKAVLRIVYHQSERFSSPEASIAVQEDHLSQFESAVFRPNNDVIFALQAGGFGAYGEWYYAPGKHISAAARKRLLDSMFDALPGDAFVMVRTPWYKQEYESAGGSDDRVYRTGYYNDCFLSSADDTGTFACYPWNESCPSVSSLQSFSATDSAIVPVGGETCNDSHLNDCAATMQGMEYYGYSFVNSLWFSTMRSKWESQGCFEQIASRLGYRYELVSATVPDNIRAGEGFTVSVTLKNTGWAPMYHSRPVYIRMLDAQGNELLYYWTGAEPRNWYAGQQEYTFSNSFKAPTILDTSSVSLSLWMPDSEPANYGIAEYAVRFANDGVWDAGNGNNVLKQYVPVLSK
ncbi:MAG: DUF4832 domain-containing protein [Granulosicoccus sp.]